MSADLRKGSRVLYYSQRFGREVEAEIIEIDAAHKHVQLNVKQGHWIPIDSVTPILGAGSLQELQNIDPPVVPSVTDIGMDGRPLRTADPLKQSNAGVPAVDASGVKAAATSLRKGDKVFLFSQSLGRDIPAHVQEVCDDGSVELDVKKNHKLSPAEQADRITRTYPPPAQLFKGDQVLWWTEKQVADATITNVDGSNGAVELSTQPGIFHSREDQQRTLRVLREPRTRHAAASQPDTASPLPQGAAGGSVPSSAALGANGRASWPCNGYTNAAPVPQANARMSEPPGMAPSAGGAGIQGRFAPGSKVKYFSASNGTWIDALVQSYNAEVNTYCLNVQPNADPARVKAADESTAAKPLMPVRTALVGADAQAAAAAAAKAKAAPKSDGNKAGVEGTILEDKPDVKWDDIAGLQVAKDQLMMAVVLPTKFPNMFSKDRPPPRGILLYGPPGTGKTHLARACATASSSTFFHVKSSDIMSKFQGESEKSVANLFASAQERAPSIIFLDEVDSFFGKRDKEGVVDDKRAVKNTFLQCMENFTGCNTPDKSLLILAATNIPWELDEAFVRRFQAKIYIPPPDHEGRRYLIRQLLNDTKHDLHEEDIESLAEATRGYSGSDLKNLAHQALMKPVIALQRATHFQKQTDGNKILWVPCAPSDKDAIQMRLLEMTQGEPFVRSVSAADFEAARLEVKTTIQDGTLEKLEEWTSKYGARA